MKQTEEKKCFKCDRILSINEFYKHKKMKDGHLNKCKSCTKQETRKREKELRKDKIWLENERARNREKYYRLGYKGLNKPSKENKKQTIKRYRQKYPEKYLAAKYTEIFLDKKTGFHLHHWSYNQKDWLDVIELSIKDHNFIHRHLIYSPKECMYRTTSGILLDSKEKHMEYIKQCKKSLA